MVSCKFFKIISLTLLLSVGSSTPFERVRRSFWPFSYHDGESEVSNEDNVPSVFDNSVIHEHQITDNHPVKMNSVSKQQVTGDIDNNIQDNFEKDQEVDLSFLDDLGGLSFFLPDDEEATSRSGYMDSFWSMFRLPWNREKSSGFWGMWGSGRVNQKPEITTTPAPARWLPWMRNSPITGKVPTESGFRPSFGPFNRPVEKLLIQGPTKRGPALDNTETQEQQHDIVSKYKKPVNTYTVSIAGDEYEVRKNNVKVAGHLKDPQLPLKEPVDFQKTDLPSFEDSTGAQNISIPDDAEKLQDNVKKDDFEEHIQEAQQTDSQRPDDSQNFTDSPKPVDIENLPTTTESEALIDVQEPEEIQDSSNFTKPIDTEEPINIQKPIDIQEPINIQEPDDFSKPINTESLDDVDKPRESSKPIDPQQPLYIQEPNDVEEPISVVNNTKSEIDKTEAKKDNSTSGQSGSPDRNLAHGQDAKMMKTHEGNAQADDFDREIETNTGLRVMNAPRAKNTQEMIIHGSINRPMKIRPMIETPRSSIDEPRSESQLAEEARVRRVNELVTRAYEDPRRATFHALTSEMLDRPVDPSEEFSGSKNREEVTVASPVDKKRNQVANRDQLDYVNGERDESSMILEKPMQRSASISRGDTRHRIYYDRPAVSTFETNVGSMMHRGYSRVKQWGPSSKIRQSPDYLLST